MSELEVIQSTIARAVERRRWHRAWIGLWQGLFIGATVWLLALGAYKLAPIPFEIVVAAGVISWFCLVGGFFRGWSRKTTAAETARWLDEKTRLQERLSSALELADKPGDQNWKQLLMVDAAAHAKTVNTRQLLPFSLPRVSRHALLVLALAAGMGFVPEYRSKEFLQNQKEKEVIKEAGAKIVELTKQNLEARKPVFEPVREALQSAEQLGEALTANPMTRTEALKDLANATDRLKNELKELGKNPGLKALDKAARNSSRNGANVPGDLQKQIDSLQKQLGKQTDSTAMDKLKDELQKAQKGAAGMPSADSGEGQAARQQMAENLADLAQQAQEMGLSLPDLNDAIAALQAGKADLFLKELDAALKDLEKMKEMAQKLEQMQNAASKMGKDLAEQLKNGQAEMAQATLQKMIEQLKSANLTPEQLQKILEDVAKAVNPASPYGEVAEHLNSACKNMKAGEKPGAAKSLADAAEELRKLMEQMGDAEQMMSALECLKRAQMCVGNCEKWSNCAGACSKPGLGKGGKPGAGVGMWADETGWIDIPETTDRWDNSGLERPDVDPRGHTDRDAGLPDSLIPTKVRGQFSPGGPMPSITLKGLNIKGESKVQFQEAVSAAQSEAQSAINQDQVPRAYRGAVRDYFDDLK